MDSDVKVNNRNSKLYIIFVILFIVVLLFAAYKKLYNDPKHDDIPRVTCSKVKNQGDKEIIKEFLEEMNNKHNTTFKVYGYDYFYYNSTGENELMSIDVYSSEYPQVFFNYCVNNERCNSSEDNYEYYIELWEIKNEMYDIASDIDINTQKLAIKVTEYKDDVIYGFILANERYIDIEDIEELLEETSEELELDKVSFKVYLTEKGNNKKYKEFINYNRFIDESKLDLDYGNWKKYESIYENDDIQSELKREHK